MVKLFVPLGLLLFISCGIAAQSEMSSLAPKATINRHYISVQANPLLRQVLSFTEVPVVANPYLLRYDYMLGKKGYFISSGGGFDFSKDLSPEGLQNSVSIGSTRIGYMRKYEASKGKFILGYGLDFIYRQSRIQTSNINKTTVILPPTNEALTDSTSVVSKDISNGFGGGIRGECSYKFSDHLSIGTELSFYYMQSKTKLNVETINSQITPSLTEITTNTVNEEAESTSFELSLPVAIYLIISF